MLRELLVRQRRQMVDRWTDRVLDAYPAEAASFLKEEKDRFRNPVGYTLADGLAKIYDGLLGDGWESGIERAVEDIVMMRAVQEFSPAEAVGFVQPLKELVGDAAKTTAATCTSAAAADLCADLSRFDERADKVTLLAVDCYVKCREKIFRTSLKEARAGGMIAAASRDRRAD